MFTNPSVESYLWKSQRGTPWFSAWILY